MRLKRAWWVVRDIMQPTVEGLRASWARLRNRLSQDGLVSRKARCPQCKERHEDKLVWDYNNYNGIVVECQSCGRLYEIWDGVAF